jgi:hypothetical protein
MMRKLALFLLLSPLTARAEEFTDPGSGLQIEIPEGWDRDTRQEQDPVKFAAILDLAPGKYVRVTIGTHPAERFTADGWLGHNETELKKTFKSVISPFRKDSEKIVGGLSAVGFTIAGKRSGKGGEEVDVRLRVYAVINGDKMVQITEVSVKKAHEGYENDIEAMWDAIAFEGAGGDEGGGFDDEGMGVSTDPIAVEDKIGNYKLVLPPGWVVVEDNTEKEGAGRRFQIVRKDDMDNNVVSLVVFRLQVGDPSVFSDETASTVVERILDRNMKWFEGYYGEGSAGVVPPYVDEGVQLGGAEKSGAFELKARTLEELEKIREAEDLVRRGEKGATIPKILPKVVRGRLAMLSPHFYIVQASWARSLNDDPKLLAEFNKLCDSFEFFTAKAKLPPLRYGWEKDGKQISVRIGNTLADPKFAKDRKGMKVHGHAGRDRKFFLKMEYKLPAGFQDLSDNYPKEYKYPFFHVVAQDELNNSVVIHMFGLSSRAGNLRDKDEEFETWKSNWESKARRSKVPRKTKKFSLGGLRGEGYRDLGGIVDEFPATFTGLIQEKKGWRTIVTVETRGEGNVVFEDALKKLFKSMKFKTK